MEGFVFFQERDGFTAILRQPKPCYLIFWVDEGWLTRSVFG